MEKKHLPFGSEFSPSQTELPELLSICYVNSGSKEAIDCAIKSKYFYNKGGEKETNKNKLAMNCRLGLKAYGVIDEDCRITEFGKRLYNIKENEAELYAVFAKHILLNLNGMGLIQCIRDMNAANETVTLETMRSACEERGIYYPSGGKHPSIMRLWLSKAGVFIGKKWSINEDRINTILGQSDNMDELRGLSVLQRCFLLALLNTGVTEWQKASSIVRLAEATYGIRFPEKNLPKLCLNGLEQAGYITIKRTTEGRGAKSPLVAPTEKVDIELVQPLLEQVREQKDPKLVELQRKPIQDILAEIQSPNRYTAGLALEALAFRLMRIIGMRYVATRLRAERTGGAEVDLVFESDRLVFSRWQIQCKNTAHVSLEDVAKEVGLTHMLRSNVIVIVSTGSISRDAKQYSNHVMNNSSLCIVLLEEDDISTIADDPTAIVGILNRQAKATMKLKRLSKEVLSNE